MICFLFCLFCPNGTTRVLEVHRGFRHGDVSSRSLKSSQLFSDGQLELEGQLEFRSTPPTVPGASVLLARTMNLLPQSWAGGELLWGLAWSWFRLAALACALGPAQKSQLQNTCV